MHSILFKVTAKVSCTEGNMCNVFAPILLLLMCSDVKPSLYCEQHPAAKMWAEYSART
jgi:hypothetical protein